MLREVHLQSRISLVMCLKPQARCVKSCRQCYTLQRAFQLPCLLLPCTEPMKIYGNPVSRSFKLLLQKVSVQLSAFPKGPCRVKTTSPNGTWTSVFGNGPIGTWNRLSSCWTVPFLRRRGQRRLHRHRVVSWAAPKNRMCRCFSVVVVFFIFMALFKRKNLTSELSIVQVRLHVCVNVWAYVHEWFFL